MITRADVERLSAVEDRMARQEQLAVWLFLGVWSAGVWLGLLPVGRAVQVVAWVASGAALVWLAVQFIRLRRAWTARAIAQSAVEEAEAMERLRARES